MITVILIYDVELLMNDDQTSIVLIIINYDDDLMIIINGDAISIYNY